MFQLHPYLIQVTRALAWDSTALSSAESRDSRISGSWLADILNVLGGNASIIFFRHCQMPPPPDDIRCSVFSKQSGWDTRLSLETSKCHQLSLSTPCLARKCNNPASRNRYLDIGFSWQRPLVRQIPLPRHQKWKEPSLEDHLWLLSGRYLFRTCLPPAPAVDKTLLYPLIGVISGLLMSAVQDTTLTPGTTE